MFSKRFGPVGLAAAVLLILLGCDPRCPAGTQLQEKSWNGIRGKMCVTPLNALEGPSRFWHVDGGVLFEIAYERGLPRGKWTAWHEGGAKAFEGEFKAGLRHGVWRYWYPGGQLLGAQSEYHDGIPAGEWTAWRKDGAQAMKVRLNAMGKVLSIQGAATTPEFYKTPSSELSESFVVKFPHAVQEAYTSMDFTKSPDQQALSLELEQVSHPFAEMLSEFENYSKELSPFGKVDGGRGLVAHGWILGRF